MTDRYSFGFVDRIIFVYVDNPYIKEPYWQLGWVDVDNRYIQTLDFKFFREALTRAKQYKGARLFIKTRDDSYPLDTDSQEVMDLLRYT